MLYNNFNESILYLFFYFFLFMEEYYMLLNLQSIKDKEAWESKGFTMPEYDVAALRKRTARKPMWLHFGAGNIFRAFPAVALQKLINAG